MTAAGYQAYIARDTERRQLQAYVSIHSGATGFPNIADPFAAIVIVKNSGQTPAYDFQLNEYFGGPLPYPFTTSCPSHKTIDTKSVVTLSSQQEEPLTVKTDKPLGITGLSVLNGGDASQRIYFCGTVTYNDIFGYSHWTRFNFSYRAVDNKGVGIEYSDHGNDADHN